MSQVAGPLIMAALCFLVAGIIGKIALKDILEFIDSKNWTKTPCIIESCNIKTTNSRRKSHTIQVLYTYNFNGRDYTSNCYGIGSAGTSSNYPHMHAMVYDYPAGKENTCYVNPCSPERSIIKRELGTSSTVGFMLLSIIFIIMGSLGIFMALNFPKY